jgi:hypothetical protein
MATTQTLVNQTLVLLNEAADSDIGDLDTGDGGAPTITTTAAVVYYLNEAKEKLCRTCFPLYGVASKAAVSGQSAYDFHSLTVASPYSSGRLWAARSVSYNGVALLHAGRAALERRYPTWQTDASGVPTVWSEEGPNGIILYLPPSGTLTIAVAGLVIPADMSAGSLSDAQGWISEGEARLLVLYAASQIAYKNFEDDTLIGRANLYMNEFNSACLARWQRIDMLLRKAHYPDPPTPVQVAG